MSIRSEKAKLLQELLVNVPRPLKNMFFCMFELLCAEYVTVCFHIHLLEVESFSGVH